MDGAYLYELLYWFLVAVVAGAIVGFLVPRRRWLLVPIALLTGVFWIVLGGSLSQRAGYALVLLWYLGGWSLGVVIGSGGRKRWSRRGS